MKLSVIIPVYNVEKYLRKCIESILKQDYKDYEVILVDDGSTDNSASICDEYVSSHNNFRVIHKKNGGVSSARNAGLEIAKGDYILFCDSDDYWGDNLLHSLIKTTDESDKSIDMLFFHYSVVDSEAITQIYQPNIKALIENPLNFKVFFANETQEHINDMFVDNNVSVFVVRILWSKSFMLQNNIYFKEDIKSGEDRLFILNALLCAPIIYLADDIFEYYYVIRGDESLTGKKNLRKYIPDYYYHFELYDKHEQELCIKNKALTKNDLQNIRLERAWKMHCGVITNELKNNARNAKHKIAEYRKREFFSYTYKWSSFFCSFKKNNKKQLVKWLLIKLHLEGLASVFYQLKYKNNK